jgi:predicted amidophosphoribosyltransferase
MRCPKCGKNLESKAKICPNCKRPMISRTEQTTTDSLYSGVLKPRSTIGIRGAGSRMGGTSSVKAVRHKITSSNESVFSTSTRCSKCDAEISKNDLFCKKCGTRTTR